MKKKYFNIFVIFLIVLLLGVITILDFENQVFNFMLIPILGFYYLGQYSERKFK